jgi:hypothetical protein
LSKTDACRAENGKGEEAEGTRNHAYGKYDVLMKNVIRGETDAFVNGLV